jgi:hypothetical protein
MDDSERVAHDYFTHLGFQNIVYEPEGKSKPPDFLLDGRVAVEVRRLNQNDAPSKPGVRPRGLEEVRIPVRKKIQRLLPSFGPPAGRHSWFIHIRFSRPVPRWRDIEAALRQHLQAFRDNPAQISATIPLFNNFVIELCRASSAHPNYFIMGGCIDRDSGGWLVPELERNLRICIDEKSIKTSAIRTKYPEWWLVLIDHINYGGKEAIHIPPSNWDKIVLIDPLDHTQAHELR